MQANRADLRVVVGGKSRVVHCVRAYDYGLACISKELRTFEFRTFPTEKLHVFVLNVFLQAGIALLE